MLSRPFSIQGIDVWKWYNELPLAQLKNVCNPTRDNVFSRSFFLNDSSHLNEENDFSELLQDALKLQDLNSQDINTGKNKIGCCGSLECHNWSCDSFWNRFNFDHCQSKELTKFRRKFDLTF